MDIEHRKYLRTASDAQVQMTHPAFGTVTVKARDLSDGGVSVLMGIHVSPPVGTVVNVIIKRHKGALNASPVPMEVRHVEPGGIVGLRFL